MFFILPHEAKYTVFCEGSLLYVGRIRTSLDTVDNLFDLLLYHGPLLQNESV